MNKFSFLLFFSFFSITICAQDEPDLPPPPDNTTIKVLSNRVFGRIMDSKTNRGIEAASVQLYQIKRIDAASAPIDELIRAKFTNIKGEFFFSDLPLADSFRLFISAVGYEPFDIAFPYSSEPGSGMMQNQFIEKDLGNIIVSQDVIQLSGVTVTAERPAMEMGVDRRIFNVDRSLTATGGTGLDVMKNIPAVSVDVDGNVQLRNATPQVFVDGRPTILTLDQIPADNIERVEVITNPSAKFDAASTAGIINVILKKNRRFGLNGIASIGAGYPNILNGSLSLNTRQGKVNLFATSNFNQSGGIAEGRTLRQNKNNGTVVDYFNQYSDNERIRRFASVRFGIDFYADNRNTISLSQNLVSGRFTNNQEQYQEFLNVNRILERYGERFSDSRNEFNRYNTQLNFNHKFPEQGKELTANLNYNYGNGNNNSNILNTFFLPDGSLYNSPNRVRNSGDNDNNQVTFQVDYSDPIGNNGKIESGIRSYINNFQSSFDAVALSNGVETLLPLSNNIEYKEVVNALYLTYSNKIGQTFSYQAGLRAEHSTFDGNLLDRGSKFGYTYPENWKGLFDVLFPSLFLTKNLSDNVDAQINYSRRIRRPNFWQLNPFLDINDPVNIRMGNPELRPEFTNSLEFNYNQKYTGGNFLGVIYYRNNQGDITRYSDTITTAQYQQLNNAAVDPNAILNTFINVQATNRLGAEFTVQHKFSKNFDITPSVDLQYRKVIAENDYLNLSNEGFSWEAKLITNYKFETDGRSFFNNLGLQLIGEYESPEIIPQGRRVEQYSVDFALRKEFLKDKKAAITFNVNDIFWTHRWGSVIDTDRFFQDSYRRNVRTFRINFSYKFGSANFQLFNRNGDRGRDNDES
jgi:outer membrane receptor protein involved in Fe transport